MRFILSIAMGMMWANLALGMDPNSRTPQREPATEKVLTAEDFQKGRVDRGSGKNEVSFAVEIHPGLPVYRFHVIPDQAASAVSGNNPQHVGRIEISRQGSRSIDQIIEVQSFGDEAMLMSFFTMEDVNFDGYLDIGTLYEFGAKWGSYSFLVYDPASGRFIRTGLTRQLRRIGANERRLDPTHRTIHFSFLSLGEARIGETYKVRNGRLILTRVEDRRKSHQGGFEIVTRRVQNGRMTILNVEREPQ